jgi:hypothetical protein
LGVIEVFLRDILAIARPRDGSVGEKWKGAIWSKYKKPWLARVLSIGQGLLDAFFIRDAGIHGCPTRNPLLSNSAVIQGHLTSGLCCWTAAAEMYCTSKARVKRSITEEKACARWTKVYANIYINGREYRNPRGTGGLRLIWAKSR